MYAYACLGPLEVRRSIDPRGLEIEMTVRHHVDGCWELNCSLKEQCSQPLSHLSFPASILSSYKEQVLQQLHKLKRNDFHIKQNNVKLYIPR